MKKKILIIEDDEMIQGLYLRIFSSAHYEIFQAFNGEEGLEKVKVILPDLIILDLIMPVMNGEIFLDEYKKNNPEGIPILISSVNVEKAQELASKYVNVFFLQKTLKKVLLLEKVKYFFEKK